ncbi:MAG TPA: hypothetical protein VKE69_11100 [Planctomycetota bacterium]|nr:hypothetical protein [Planctomycetota bacterium]
MTRSTFALVGVLALTAAPSIVALAEDPTEEQIAELKEKRDKKLASPWVKEGGWITNLDEAKKKASETGHPILAYFSRSYAP